ncbi:uncharacterized protein LOC135834796 [Planococcus citri]|uniref:uncharacterized protein LOC135834796 n=1 Tax=Planococcus citri TaxID=170843 RepID=UPI0031F9837F
MYFTFIICHLVLLINFSVEASKLRIKQPQVKDEPPHDSKQEETNKSEKFIKKSDLEDLVRLKNLYFVRNYMEEFETHLALHFIPNWNQVDAFKSPAKQSIEIRRQKWEYILHNFNDSHIVQRLNTEMKEAGINQTTFCNDMAEIYFTLSDNAYIFDKQFNPDKEQKSNQSIGALLHKKSVLVFMNSISGSKLKFNPNEDLVQLPKSIYIELMRKDAHASLLKQHYVNRMQRLRNAYKKKIRHIREDQSRYIDSDVSSY